MRADEVLAFRKTLADDIGLDYIHVRSEDEGKYLYGARELHEFAGFLFLTFSTGVAHDVLIEMAKEAGKQLVKLVSESIVERLKKIAAAQHDGPTPNPNAQLDAIREGTDVLQEISAAVSKEYLDGFLGAGRKALVVRLKADHFPDKKAEALADRLTQDIRKQIQKPSAARESR